MRLSFVLSPCVPLLLPPPPLYFEMVWILNFRLYLVFLILHNEENKNMGGSIVLLLKMVDLLKKYLL